MLKCPSGVAGRAASTRDPAAASARACAMGESCFVSIRTVWKNGRAKSRVTGVLGEDAECAAGECVHEVQKRALPLSREAEARLCHMHQQGQLPYDRTRCEADATHEMLARRRRRERRAVVVVPGHDDVEVGTSATASLAHAMGELQRVVGGDWQLYGREDAVRPLPRGTLPLRELPELLVPTPSGPERPWRIFARRACERKGGDECATTEAAEQGKEARLRKIQALAQEGATRINPFFKEQAARVYKTYKFKLEREDVVRSDARSRSRSPNLKSAPCTTLRVP